MIRMKTGFLLFFLGWAQLNAHSQEITKLSLKESVDIALKNNIEVKQAALRADQDEVNRNQARTNLLPDLNGSFGFGWNQGRNIDPITNAYVNQQLASSSIGINSNVVLFSGLQQHNLIKQTNLAYEASKLDHEQAKNTLTLNVMLAYLQVLNNEDILEISKGQREVTRKQVQRLEVMVKEGAVGSYQLADLKAQLSSDEISIVTNQNAVQVAKLSLCQLLNIPYNKDLELVRGEQQAPPGLYESTADQVYRESLETFAQVKAGVFREKSLTYGVKVARGAFFPTLSFGANLGSSYSSAAMSAIPGATVENATGTYVRINNVEYNVLREDQTYSFKKIAYGKQLDNNLGNFYGFNLRVPLFNNLRVRNQVKLATINLRNAELQNENIRLLLRQSVDQAYLNMTATFERYRALQQQVANYEESFRAAEIRFGIGDINPAEYIIVKNNLDRSRVNLVIAQYEYILRTRVLDYYRTRLVW